MTNKPPETKTKEGIELASQPSWAQEEVGAFQRGEKRYLDLHLSE
jgi:hypothetical protein